MRNRNYHPPHRDQRGAALYVALIMLVLLSLIGIIGMQVSGLQEKMSSNFRIANLAFQNAEASVRRLEMQIKQQVTAGALDETLAAMATDCSSRFDAADWVRQQSGPQSHVHAMGTCMVGGYSQAMGKGPAPDIANQVFQITVVEQDAETSSAEVALDVIYIP